ncbi:MAG: ATP-binding cassette domain-containing protein [Bacteroidota bacterium]|nr:ATP-binding cassette domain-containing protein [Bacteroidota bacterium]
MLEIKHISKRYKDFHLDDISFSVEGGDYFVLLGESGAGKSLILEIIAGLIVPDKGEIAWNGKNITNEKIQKRRIGLVFQDYAVFPHLTVKANIAFPLKSKGVDKHEINRKVGELAGKMSISHLLERRPNTLSGGELQRVALARTLALKPDCLLLDEPLASLDVQLRDGLQSLLRQINNEGITIVHITHNFEEAVALADRVGIIFNGKIIQEASPKEVFHNPKSKFIANFAGIKNFYKAEIKSGESIILDNKAEIVNITGRTHCSGFVMFRGEDVVVSGGKTDSSICNNFQGIVLEMIPTKHGVEVIVDAGIIVSALITYKSSDMLRLGTESPVWISIKASAIRFIESG